MVTFGLPLYGREYRFTDFLGACSRGEGRNHHDGTVDGISFIEKLSFNAFNEGTRLVHCTSLHRRLFGVDVKKIGGDTGYAGTGNRDFCKENKIQTSFVKRGRPFGEKKKEKDLVRKELARVRYTSFSASTRRTWCSLPTESKNGHSRRQRNTK